MILEFTHDDKACTCELPDHLLLPEPPALSEADAKARADGKMHGTMPINTELVKRWNDYDNEQTRLESLFKASLAGKGPLFWHGCKMEFKSA